VKTSALPYPNDDIERRLRAGCRVGRRLSELTKAYQELTTKNGRNLTAAMQAMVAVKSPAEFIELQQRLIKEGVETAVGDSQRISQLTTAVFTATFEPVKKRIKAVQNSAHP
jgi:phasin family protein